MKDKFNLSEKINDYGYNDDRTPDSDILEVKDVKEFIKQSDNIRKDFFDYLQIEFRNEIISEKAKAIILAGFLSMQMRLSKLAGDKLVEQK